MLYPVMPIYLKTIGFSIVLIGFLEGVAEATAGLTKGYFGKLSDTSGKRAPFVQIGYALSMITKPMMAFLTYPLWIFFCRTIDRLGKGVRTGARDAMLSEEATRETKGKVFGFHRSMDTVGAVIGPSLALLYLYFYPGKYITLFYIAFIPGLIAVLISFFLKDKHKTTATDKAPVSFFAFIKYWKTSPALYKKVVIGLLFFTLFNSSDVFLLLKAKQSRLNDQTVIGLYIAYNLVFALTSFPLGIIADKIGLKKMLLFGLSVFAIVYWFMGLNSNVYVIAGLFLLYGLYAGATEGIAKAWITNMAHRENTATAIGFYTSCESTCTLFASFVAGVVWSQFGSFYTFALTATIALITCLYLVLATRSH